MALTVCAVPNTYSSGDIVLFPVVTTVYDVSKLALSALGTSGKFKCEKAGLYLISAFLMTNTKGHVEFHLLKNSNIIASFFYVCECLSNKYHFDSATFRNQRYHIYTSSYKCICFWWNFFMFVVSTAYNLKTNTDSADIYDNATNNRYKFNTFAAKAFYHTSAFHTTFVIH